jgi:transcription elongation factor GreA
MDEIIMTQSALDKLQTELDERIGRREEVAARIERAREFGDLKENGEYHEAREAQGFNEGRIAEIEHIMKNAIVREKSDNGLVQLGSTIDVEVNGRSMTFEIVSFNESDPANGKISNQSPIGAALMHQKAGNEVEVETPSGAKVLYKIVEVR